MRCFRSLFWAIPLMASSVFAFDTDRPEGTESSSVVGQGVLQVESGFRYAETQVSGANVDRLNILDSLVRYGITETFEISLDWDGYISRELSGVRTDNGISDAALGAKLYLHEETRKFGETALLGQLSLPVGDEEFSSDGVDPSVVMAMSHTLVNDYALGYSIGVGFLTHTNKSGKEDTDSSLLYGIQLERSYTEQIAAYAEVYGAQGLSADADLATLGVGVNHAVRQDIQLTAKVGFGLTDESDDWFVGVGIAFRP
ncbi:MAG: transporter [Verrucomicrobia bacterium]|nr:transporter [Verrucomicrobiota bacterium]